jgi:hypothetical protein
VVVGARMAGPDVAGAAMQSVEMKTHRPPPKQSFARGGHSQTLSLGTRGKQFARDFLAETGFQIETPPDRGADGGKDFLVTERLVGKVNTYPFRWLVSCKHFAKSKKSVSEKDEPNIRERLESFRAGGNRGHVAGASQQIRRHRQQAPPPQSAPIMNQPVKICRLTPIPYGCSP